MAIVVKKSNGNAFFPSFANLMEDFFNDDFFGQGALSKPSQGLRRVAAAFQPAVNIRETEEAFLLELSAAGLKKEDFQIELNSNILSIAAEQQQQEEQTSEEGRFIRREFSRQSFKRSFALPEDAVEADKIEARYEDGVLKLQLPKRKAVEVETKKVISIS